LADFCLSRRAEVGHERPVTNGCFATVYALFDAYIDDANVELTQVLKQD
jgi:hypothetical protein